MRPADNNERKAEYGVFSRSIQIGIYGYFSKSHKEELIKLKRFLQMERKLNAKMSDDFENLQIPIISAEADAILCSEMLYDSSKIHIFVVIPSNEENNRVLDSVSMEYGWAWKNRDLHVGVYFKKDFDLSTLPQGALDVMHESWHNESFDNLEEIFLNISAFCEARIREIFCSSDAV